MSSRALVSFSIILLRPLLTIGTGRSSTLSRVRLYLDSNVYPSSQSIFSLSSCNTLSGTSRNENSASFMKRIPDRYLSFV